MTQQPLHYKTLAEVATRIAEGDLDSVSVTEALLGRIESLEPRLHSYITVMGERALARAEAADAARSRSAVTEEEIAQVGHWIGMIAQQAGLDVPRPQTLF